MLWQNYFGNKICLGVENKEEKIEILRKKLKILKAALIKERQAKGLVDQEIGEFKRRNQLLQTELDEKVINNSKSLFSHTQKGKNNFEIT